MMELVRTRYSTIKIDDDSKVISDNWEKIQFDQIDLKRFKHLVDIENFDIIIFPLKKKFALKQDVDFEIFPRGEGSDSGDKFSDFLKNSSDLLRLQGNKILSIFFYDDDFKEKVFFASRLEIYVKEPTDFVELFLGKNAFSCINSIDFKLFPFSHLKYFSFEDSNGSFSIQKRFFNLDKDAKLDFGRIWSGNSIFFSFDNFLLEGYGASCSVLDVIFGRQKKSLEINSRIDHIGENTSGYLSARAVMYDSAVLNYVGGAKVWPKSFNSDSYVELKGIKMSDSARIYFVPLMEIDTSLVKAKHSSSIGKVGENELFYMMSRGLDENEAREIIVEGFVREVVSKMNIPDLISPTFPFLYQKL